MTERSRVAIYIEGYLFVSENFMKFRKKNIFHYNFESPIVESDQNPKELPKKNLVTICIINVSTQCINIHMAHKIESEVTTK